MIATLVLAVAPVRAATHAVVIGHNGGLEPDTAPLRYADDDAIQYAALFEQLGAQVHLLVEPDAATRELHPTVVPAGPPTRAGLAEALARVGPSPAALYFVYAGHGDLRHGEGYLALADGPFYRRDLRALVLDGVAATHKHVIIDACKSYFMVFARGDDEERIRVEQPFDLAPDLGRWPNTGIVLSTSAAQNSHEWEAFQAGVFSHEVRSALRGAADLDGDAAVSYPELAAFVFNANAGIPNEKYRPRFLIVPPATDVPVVDLRGARGQTLWLDRAEAHHYSVENTDGVRVADLRPAASATTRLLLPPRPHYVRDTDADREFRVEGDQRLSALVPQRPKVVARGAAHEAFERLFARPFDREALAASRLVLLDRGAALNASRPPPSAHRIWIGAAASATLAAAGAGFRLLGDAAHAEHERAPAEQRPGLRRTTERYDTTATVLWGAAAVAAAGTLVTWALDNLD